MCTTPWLDRVSKESYNLPDEVYAHCKKLGMSIVTLTDHDSIDAAEKRLKEYTDTWASRGVRAWAEGWWRMPITVGDAPTSS